MKLRTPQRYNCVSRLLALEIAAAGALSFVAVTAIVSSARAQRAPQPAPAHVENTLPPVTVQQKAPPAVSEPAPAPKQTAKPKVKSAPVQQAEAPPPPAQEAVEVAQEPTTPATALGTYNPALDVQGLKIPPGTTLTTAGPVYGYQALSAISSTKTATPIEQIPQSIQVVPKSVIEDQGSRTVTEALRNVSNVQGLDDLSIGNTDLQPLRLRGFDAEQWLDGLVVNYNAGDRSSFANVERIEVLKGPSAILYGGGPGAPVGGAVNVISKLPTNKASGEFGVTVGSHNFVQPYFDVNQPLSANGTVLFRVTGEYTAAESFIDVLEQERYSINPTLTLTNKTDTTLTIQGRKSRYEQQAYQGLPAVGTVTGSFRLDPNLYIGSPDIPKSFTAAEGVTVTLDHKIDPVWSFNVKGRWSRTEFDQNSQATFFGFPAVGSQWEIFASEVQQEQEELTINPNLQARFAAGPTRNTLLFGADYSRVTDRGHHFSDTYGNLFYIFGLAPPAMTVDLLNPRFPIPYVDPTPSNATEFVVFGDIDNLYVTKGAYSQIQTSIYDRVHLMAGLRVASIEVDYVDLIPTFSAGSPVTTTTDRTRILPRVGAVVDVADGLSIYASYSEGMRWAGFVAPPSGRVEPEESEQREVGLKFNLASNFTGTVSAFDIQRTNVPVLGIASTQFAKQRSRGFEADIIWQPSRSWQVLASYGFIEAEFADSLIFPRGNKLDAIPEQSGRLWINHAFEEPMLRGWSAGAGIYASSGAFVDNTNIWKTEPYFLVDAKIGYANERFAATLFVKNLTDEKYFTPYPWFGGQVAPGADRQFFGTVVYKY
ncbi:MAG: TonB-dependent siderophore receptor [Hyphomicrobium sp.]|nr:MAG: TonB-dependent siderophore receptor [Hyphomicrobium sp.]